MSGQEIVQQLRPLISVILETLSDILPELDEDYDLGENDSLHKLYEEFQNMIMPDDDNELVEMFLDGEGTEEEVDAILASTSEVSFLQHIHNITDKKPNSIRSDEWITLLRSHGWSSEGPLGSGGRTSGGSVFNLQTDRVNGNKDVKVTVTITNGVSGTLDLKDSQSQQTHSLYCDTTGTYTFKNVGARAGYIIVTNTSPVFMVNYPSGS